MKYLFTAKFTRDYHSLSRPIQEKFNKQLVLLLRDLRHPSLHAKKYDEVNDIWQARVDRKYRFRFLIKDAYYILLTIGPHPK